MSGFDEAHVCAVTVTRISQLVVSGAPWLHVDFGGCFRFDLDAVVV